VEDQRGASPVEANGDFNDLMFQISGSLSVLAPMGGMLTPGMVDESGAIFWDQNSYDGSDYNFGYCVTGLGNCHVSGIAPGPFEYFAGPGGSAPLSEMFEASGPVTFLLLAKETSNSQVDNLGWFDPSSPGVLHPIFAGPDSIGTSITFVPSPLFALYSTNGLGQFYASMAADNLQESTTQQHFALVEQASSTNTPEPATFWLAGGALAMLLFRGRPVRGSRRC
jgi:hypothetical protein